MRPGITIIASNGQLGLQAPSEFGTVGILIASPIAPVAGYSVPFLIRNVAQLTTAFAQAGNEAALAALLAFYSEASEGGKLYIMAMAPTTTLTVLLAPANANKLLNMGNGDIRLVAVIKFPSGSYAPTITTGFDDEVFTAVIAAQTLADSWFANKKPFRVFIEGYGFVDAGTAKDYVADTKRNVAIIVGNINASTAMVTIQALGRAAASGSQQNIGRIKSGSLKIAEDAVVKIGAVTVEQMIASDLDLLYAKRYITLERNEIGSGYVFNDDNMLTTPADDYNSLTNGRVIDNATRVAFATFYRDLKDDVDVDENGRLSIAVEKALETEIETAINTQMPGQLSRKKDGTADVECLVNPDYTAYAQLYEANSITDPNFSILQTNNIYIFLRLKPKGQLKYITVLLGYTA
jgi:hypothetical protein